MARFRSLAAFGRGLGAVDRCTLAGIRNPSQQEKIPDAVESVRCARAQFAIQGRGRGQGDRIHERAAEVKADQLQPQPTHGR
jgi:hypothetical protein